MTVDTPVRPWPFSVCIVTPDLVGVVRNGGVGTACAELARALADAGAAVTVFFSQVGALADGDGTLDEARAGYRRGGIDLVMAEAWAGSAAQAMVFPPHPLLRMSRIVHAWLKERRFDIVLFMDWQGAGFYPMMARRAGIAHRQHGVFAVVCHGSTLWSDLGNGARRRDPLDAITYFIERRGIEMADAVISPSRYLLEWMRERGFRLPSRVLARPNLLAAPAATVEAGTPEAVVFFGRLEYRKGIVQFCSAIDRLVARGEAPPRVVFLGKLGFVGDEHAAVYLARRCRDWPMPVEIHHRLSQPEALRVLTTRRCLAVVPSTVENSPYTVYECLMAGVPVIARDVGGIAELYASADRQTHLFGDNPDDLAERIAAALSGRLGQARLSFCPDENRTLWLEGLSTLVTEIRSDRRDPIPETRPLVSICLTHYRRPRLLAQAVRAVLAQTYPRIEVILVDDGSNEAETEALLTRLEADPATRDWRIRRVRNGFPGRARNIAAAEASGAYLLFLDDDNVARPEMVESLVSAALRSGADAVTCFAAVFEGHDEPGPRTRVIDTYMPVGGALGYALAGNAVSDTSALMRRALFDDLGGFTEDYGLGHEDFELFLSAVLRGKDILVVPEPLYWYRRQEDSVGAVTPHAANRLRSLRAFLDRADPDMAELLVVAHGLVDVAAPPVARDGTTVHRGDLSVLARRDPDSWQAIDVAAAIIAVQGATDLATQLLRRLPDDTPGAQVRGLRVRLIETTVGGDLRSVNAVLRHAERLGPDVLREMVSLSARMAWARRQPIAIRILRRWAHSDVDALEPRLVLVEALEADGRTGDAFESFADALRVGERLYRTARPDVDVAVSRGDFEAALVHYARHGRHERAPWPEASTFGRLAVSLHRSLAGRRLVAPPDVVHWVRLGFAAFAPDRTLGAVVQNKKAV